MEAWQPISSQCWPQLPPIVPLCTLQRGEVLREEGYERMDTVSLSQKTNHIHTQLVFTPVGVHIVTWVLQRNWNPDNLVGAMAFFAAMWLCMWRLHLSKGKHWPLRDPLPGEAWKQIWSEKMDVFLSRRSNYLSVYCTVSSKSFPNFFHHHLATPLREWQRLKPLAAWRPAHRTPWRRWRWSPPWHIHTWPASSRFIAKQVARYLDLWKKTLSQWAWDIESQLIVESKIGVLPGLDSRTHIPIILHLHIFSSCGAQGWFRKKRQDQLYFGAKGLPQWWCSPRGG